MNEDTDDFVDWLCWMWAQDLQRFTPPDETALDCVKNATQHRERDYMLPAVDDFLAYEWELAQHQRAANEAKMKLDDAKQWGMNPIERAEREHSALQERASSEIDDLDWEYL